MNDGPESGDTIVQDSPEGITTTVQPEVISSDQMVTSALELADTLSNEQYYLFGGSWIELALQTKGIAYKRKHDDIDVAIGNLSSIAILQQKGCTPTEKPHIREGHFFSGTDKLGTPLEVMVREIHPQNCINIVLNGRRISGRELELEYLEKKYVIAMAKRHSKEVRGEHISDVQALEQVVDLEVVDQHIKEYAEEEGERLKQEMMASLETNGIVEYINLVNQQVDIPEHIRRRVLLTLQSSINGKSINQIVQSLNDVINEYSEHIVRERYGLIQTVS